MSQVTFVMLDQVSNDHLQLGYEAREPRSVVASRARSMHSHGPVRCDRSPRNTVDLHLDTGGTSRPGPPPRGQALRAHRRRHDAIERHVRESRAHPREAPLFVQLVTVDTFQSVSPSSPPCLR